MTQVEITKVLELKPDIISKYEDRTLEPNMESLKKLAELLAISVNELLKENEFDASKINVLEVLKEQKRMELIKLADYMLDVADKELTEQMIREFHKILKERTSDSRKEWFNVGGYKKLANEAGNIQTFLPKNVDCQPFFRQFL